MPDLYVQVFNLDKFNYYSTTIIEYSAEHISTIPLQKELHNF
jgi:hypothetical protein